jgi:hypothetical protein
MHIQQYQSTSEKVLYMFFTCLAILIFACKNISNEHVSRKGQEQVFDNISMGYDQLKDSI